MSDDNTEDEASFEGQNADVTRSPFVEASYAILKKLERNRFDYFISPTSLELGLYWEALQPLGLILHPYVGLSSWAHPFHWVFMLAFVWDGNEIELGTLPLRVVFWMAATAVVMIVLILVAGTGFSKELSANVIRCTSHAMSGLLYMPLLHVFTSRMSCTGQGREALWTEDTETCGTHLIIIEFVVAITAFVLLAALSLCMNTTLMEIVPGSFHPQARSSSTVDVVIWAYRTFSVIAYHCLLSRRMSQEYCAYLCLATTAVFVYIIATLPYHRHKTTQAKTTVLLIVAVASLLCIFHEDDVETSLPERSNAIAVLVVVLGVLAVPLNWFSLSYSRISSKCLKEMQSFVEGKGVRRAEGAFPNNLPDNDQLVSRYEDLEGWLLEAEAASSGTQGSNKSKPDLLVPYIESIWIPSDIELATRFLSLWRDYTGRRPTDRMLAMASRIYTKGLLKYPQSREVHVHFAAFLITYIERSHIAISVISSLESSHQIPRFQFVSHYTIFKMANRLRAELGIRDKAHCQALEQVKLSHKQALCLMHEFWVQVGEKTEPGGLKILANLAHQITEKREKAKSTFHWMLSQHPHDTQILTQYAQFLQQVMLDDAAYDRCLEEIEKIQQKRASNRTQTSTTSRANDSRSFIAEESSKEHSSTSEGSRTVKILQLSIRVAFLPLVALIATLFTLFYLYMANHEVLVAQAYSCGQTRYLSQKVGTTLQSMVSTATKDESRQVGESTPQLVAWRLKLKAVAKAFAAHHNRVTYGSSAASNAAHRSFMKTKQTSLEYFDTAASDKTLMFVSPWSLGNFVSLCLAVLLQVPEMEVPAHQYTKFLLSNLDTTVSQTFNNSAYYSEQESDENLNRVLAISTILFASGLVLLILVYLMFIWNFNKIATSKITTLYLFALIPDATLRTTAEDARKKLAQFSDEDESIETLAIPDVQHPGPEALQDSGRGGGGEDERLQAGLSMTDAEAIESLCARRESAVAMVLKRGLADAADLHQKEKTGNLNRSRRADSIVLGKEVAIALQPAQDGISEQALHSTEVEEEVHVEGINQTKAETDEDVPDTPRAAGTAHHIRIGGVVLFLCVVIVIAASLFLIDYDDLKADYDNILTARKLIQKHKDTVEEVVTATRMYCERGDAKYYKHFWKVHTSNVFRNIERELHQLELNGDEAKLLSEMDEQLEAMDQRMLISLALITQYFKPSIDAELQPDMFTEVTSLTWGREALSRKMLEETPILDTILPGLHRHSDVAHDTLLPNNNTPDIGDLITQHVSDTYTMGTELGMYLIFGNKQFLDLDRQAVHKARIVALAAKWLEEGGKLTRRTTLLKLSAYEEMMQPFSDLASPHGKGFSQYMGSEVAFEQFMTRLESYATIVSDSVTGSMLPLPGAITANGAELHGYPEARDRWNMTLHMNWGLAGAAMRAAAHAIVYTSFSAATLSERIAAWQKVHEDLPDGLQNFTTEKTHTVQLRAAAQEVSAAQSDYVAKQKFLLLVGGNEAADMTAWHAEARVLIRTDEKIHHVLILKNGIGRSVVNDDLFEHHSNHLLAKTNDFSDTLTSRLDTLAADAKELQERSLQVAIGLYIVLGVVAMVVLGHMAVRGLNHAKSTSHIIREVSWPLCLIVFAFVSVVLSSQSIDALVEVENANYVYQDILTREAATTESLRGVSRLAFRFLQSGDPIVFMQYFKVLEKNTLSHALQMQNDESLLAPGADTEEILPYLMSEASSILKQAEKVRWVERIAFRMYFEEGQIGLLQVPEEPEHEHRHETLHVSEAPIELQTQRWDVYDEPDYAKLAIVYPGDFARNTTYTRFEDQIGDTTQARLALVSDRYETLIQKLSLGPSLLARTVRETWVARAGEVDDKVTDTLQTLRIIALLLVVLLTLVGLMYVYNTLDTTQGSSQEAEAENDLRDHFRRLTRTCRIALMCVTIFIIAIFAVTYVSQMRTRSEVQTINHLSSAQWLVSHSLLISNKLLEDHATVVPLQIQLLRNAADIRHFRKVVYLSNNYEMPDAKLLFEGTYTDQGVIPNCVPGTVYSPPQMSIDERLMNFVTMIETIAWIGRSDHAVGTKGDTSDAILTNTVFQNQQVLEATVQLLNQKVDPLLDKLQLLTARFKDDATARTRSFTVYVVLVVCATLLFILIEYQFIFLPMLVQLTKEENGTRLMLNIIPMEVRDAVPEIAQFFSTGKVDEDEKMKKLLQQSEKLLQNILPPIISRRLKAGESLIADDHAQVTVSFSALVGFDTYSRTMSAKEIVSFLNDLYSKFDFLTDKLDLEKIKTIGDIYFMCGGLTEVTRENHALRVVETVLQFFETLQEHKEKYNTPDLLIKAGINSGPAVAGVIGSKKVAYDLWGDAVNVSSRLCGSCLPGRIALYETTYHEVKEYFNFTARQVQAKGKGLITTYMIDSRVKSTPYAYLFGGLQTNQHNIDETEIK